MKKTILSLALLLFAASAFAQSVIENKELPDFTAIALSGNMNVELIAGEVDAIEVQLYESDIKRFTWSVDSHGVLSVSLRPTVGQKARADVRLYYKADIKSVTVNGARLTANDEIVSSIFRLAVSGGGNASVAVAADDVEVEAAANSAVVVTGETTYLSIRANWMLFHLKQRQLLAARYTSSHRNASLRTPATHRRYTTPATPRYLKTALRVRVSAREYTKLINND